MAMVVLLNIRIVRLRRLALTSMRPHIRVRRARSKTPSTRTFLVITLLTAARHLLTRMEDMAIMMKAMAAVMAEQDHSHPLITPGR